MTNSEAIEQLKFLKKVDFHVDTKESCDIAISALEENTKLKAEIEQLKEDYNVLARQYDNVENSSIRYYNEVKQLKSELEQSVKLPCKVGDIVYRVNGKIIPMTIESVLIKNRNGNILIRIDCIENEFKGEFSYISDSIQNDIGKIVFITREEAEQHLKGLV